ncbi:MAG: hypothetical protein HY541_03810 [Deltaproteobacteria bacterium]|nr:hypothetical protein [Deltaproteobacteria bacterium]
MYFADSQWEIIFHGRTHDNDRTAYNLDRFLRHLRRPSVESARLGQRQKPGRFRPLCRSSRASVQAGSDAGGEYPGRNRNDHQRLRDRPDRP